MATTPLSKFLELSSNHTILPSYNDIEDAYYRIRSYIHCTPLVSSPAFHNFLSSLSSSTPLDPSNTTTVSSSTKLYPPPQIYLKLESEQVTGSFKARGAVNCITALTTALDHTITTSSSSSTSTPNPIPSICTASTGNHALAINYSLHTVPQAKKYNLIDTARIYLPKTVAKAKLDALQAAHAPLYIIDTNDCIASELAAIEYSKSNASIIYISPYNNYYVVMGQGTIGIEILYQLSNISLFTNTLPVLPSRLTSPLVVLVPTGGGGMISGIACAIKAKYPYPQSIIIACQPETNACMLESVIKKKILPEGEFTNGDTWSDGTAGGIEDLSCTYTACQDALTTKNDIIQYLHSSKDLFYNNNKTNSSVVEQDITHHRLVDGILTCTEEEIESSMLFMLSKHHKVSKLI